jgi:predicted ATP-grasp superfamily ATP-dependent carboligase
VNQPLAIVGASTRAAAASAIRAGFLPVTADLFADADLRAIATTTRISPYPDGFLDWLRTIEPPAWMYTGALENHPELVDQMAWIAPLWGNPGDVLQRVRSPWELAATLRAAGLLFPETRPTAAGLPQDGSWLAKTYRGASGSGVREFGIPFPFGEGLRQGSEPSSTVFQRRIPGTPAAAVFADIDGVAVLEGITRQLIGEPWLGAHGFQYAGSIGPLPVATKTKETIEHLGQVLTEEFELTGLFGIDFMLDGDQVWTIEVNPRYTASVEICERVTGSHAIVSHVAGIASAPVSALNMCARASTLSHGKAILFAKRDIRISHVFAEMSLAEALRTPWPTLADVSPAGTVVDAGRPILTVFAEGETIEAVEQRLQQRVEELERLIYGGDPP